MISVNKFIKDYHPVKQGDNNLYGGISIKHDTSGIKGQSILHSEESEEIFDDEIQSSSEGSLIEENVGGNSARIGSEYQSNVESGREGEIASQKNGGELKSINVNGKQGGFEDSQEVEES